MQRDLNSAQNLNLESKIMIINLKQFGNTQINKHTVWNKGRTVEKKF